jgi:DNA polymerase elongation subunit (family B)
MMVLAYLDIETYSPGKEPMFSDKAILIYYKEELGGDVVLKLKEWEEGEKSILSKFYDMLRKRLALKRTFTLIGWNIIRFDIPFLTYRLFFHKIDNLDNILEIFRRAYWRDLRQCLLPFNSYRFKGLNEEDVAKRLDISPSKYSNRAIKTFYEKHEYKKIEEHAMSEMRFLSALSWKMRNLKEILKAFDVVV